MNINLRNDYSTLFSSMFSGSSGSVSGFSSNNLLADYASIKNGSYGKLLKAYYNRNASDDESTKTTSANKFSSKPGASTSLDSTETLAKIQSTTDKLKESADTLLTKGKDSVFESEKEDAAYNAVSTFITDYNSVLSAAEKSNSTSILQKTSSMVSLTKANEKMLSKIGITVNSDNSLSLDKEAFEKADQTTVKNVFQGTGSYGYNVSASASFINFKADTEAAKANTYNSYGSYNSNFTSGSIYNSFF